MTQLWGKWWRVLREEEKTVERRGREWRDEERRETGWKIEGMGGEEGREGEKEVEIDKR